ncbi:alpha/beta fold hydrolase [Nocardia sp. NPDC088792]|uniref:alpha/beta fold hydrolase n=1 Tax=Nocardia sp. NPDC088792 TaxID=3364332 RepID=UPI0038196DF9
MKALFIHGIEDQGASWRETCAALDADFDCAAPDFPWQRGTRFTWLCTRSPHDAVVAELERVHPEICVAHSFGALALIEALLLGPEELRPRAIVLIAPFYLNTAERLDWRLLDRTRIEFANLMRDSIVARARRVGRTVSEETIDLMVGKLISGINPLAFTELFGHFALMQHRPLEDLAIPGRLLGSADDPGFAGDRARELGSRLGLETTLLPGRDHFLHYTAPQTVADTIQSIVPKVSRA